jgi:uncharacterized membrane protein
MQFEIKVQIHRPVKEVFRYISMFSNHSDMISANIESRQTSQGPVKIGTTMKNKAKFMGINMEEHFIVTEFIQDKLLAKESIPGSTFATGDKMTLEEKDGGTQLTFYVYANLTGLFKLFDNYFGKKVKASLTADMERLKRDFESGKI